MRHWRFLALAAMVPCTMSACVILIQKKTVEEPALATQRSIVSPLRVFLRDGSVVVFRNGAVVGPASVRGAGQRFDLFRDSVGPVAAISLDSILGLEAFQRATDPVLSILASMAASSLAVVGGAALAVAIFGSCPTVYSMTGEVEVLEAETFSYSISPLLEGRDVDELSVAADAGGIVRLEIRNEALETHFINHLELLEVRHGPSHRVMPDNEKLPVVVGPIHTFNVVTDRSGRAVTAELAATDEHVFSTALERLNAVSTEDSRDWIEAVLPPMPSDTAAVVLRLRNSLLNTVLFYDFVLAVQGAGALDWMARDMERIGAAVELGSWFNRTMGLRLEVETQNGFEEVARFGDTGPIAWSEVAFRVPARPDQPTRFRLSFLADEWRIDQLGWSSSIERPAVRVLPVESLEPLHGPPDPSLLSRVSEPDDQYLVTSSGSGFTVRFDAGPLPAAERRTFLLASQGYYTEWIRPDWIRTASATAPFRPTPELVPALIDRWLDIREEIEADFYATRIPVK